MDIIGCLPPEISQRVLLYLDLKDIEVISNGMEEWKHLFDNFFWKKLCFKNGYQEEEACLCSDIYKESMLKHSLHWQAICTYNRVIQSNWRSDNYKSIFITENKEPYLKIVYFDDELLIAGRFSMHSIYDIINLSTGNIHFSFQENNSVRKMLKHQNLLIYVMSETVKILNLETKSWILNLKLELLPVFYFEEIHMEVYNNLLAILHSSRQFFCVINLETKKLNLVMEGVFDGCFGDNIIIMVLYRNKLIVYDLNGKPLMNIASGGGLHVKNIMAKNGYVIICYSEITGLGFKKVSLCTIHQETKSLQEIRSIQVSYEMLRFPNQNTMLFWNCIGRNPKTYKIWRYTIENRYVAFEINENELLSIIANNRHMFLYTKDKILRLWCLETGKFIKNISRNDMGLYFSRKFQVTEKKFAYIGSDMCLHVLNYDFIPK